jgi:hypothetical protein
MAWEPSFPAYQGSWPISRTKRKDTSYSGEQAQTPGKSDYRTDTGLVLWVSVTALRRAYRAGLLHDLKEDLLNCFSLYGRCLVARVIHESYDARGEQAIDTEPIPASTLEPATQPFQRHESGEKCAESPQEDWPHSGCDTRATA